MAEKFTDTPLLTSRFDRAMQLALDHHRMQLRKDTKIPYVSHLIAVAGIVLELGGSEDEAIAALLHDAVEDGGGPMMQKRITWEFDAAVGKMVDENSDSDSAVKGDWAARKAAYIEGMKIKGDGSLLVSLADKLHNARAIKRDVDRDGFSVWDRFTATGPETADYYGRLATAFEVQMAEADPAKKAAVKELRELADALKAMTA